ncbi:MAG: glycosyltransferase family protein [Azoarcus sp.]|jgi:GT2 family glycosyltransferase|nr:glycosyltransferase family protein [Azoarcus sp.]
MSAPRFSIIVCSIDAWKFAKVSACYARLLAGVPFEIIGIHNAHSLAEGYNQGLHQCRGEIVVFSHDDVLFLDHDFARKIGERMQDWDVLGFAGSSRAIYPIWFAANWPHLYGAACHWALCRPGVLTFDIYGANGWPVSGDIRLLDGLCMIARREVAAAVGFDDETFDGWHLYDCDFSFAASRAGYRIGVCCDIPYIHASTSIQTTESAFDSSAYTKYVKRFLAKYREEKFPEYRLTPLQSVGLALPDHHTLKQLWNETTFRRATLAITRQHAAKDSAACAACPP